MTRHIVVNGKFLMNSFSGVRRVAEELVCSLDTLLTEDSGLGDRYTVEVFAPKKPKSSLGLKTISLANGGLFTWQGGVLNWILWEQLDLPRRRQGATYLSLSNVGPAMTRNAVTMFHDAQVYIAPESYSTAFRVWYKFIQPLVGKRHKHIVTVSNYSKKTLVDFKVAPAEKISVIHNGVDHILRSPTDPTAPDHFGLQSRGYVLALANTQSHKNVQILLEAFKAPRLKDLKLVLYGSGDHNELARLAGGVLPANAVLAGKISDGQLRGLIENALCLAFPSLTEGFGLPPLEAMLLGCPAVVAPCGALPEVCGDATLYADPASAEDWVVKIASLHDSPADWQAWSDRARVQAAQFTWKRAARQLLELL